MNIQKIKKLKSSRPFALLDIPIFVLLAILVITFMIISLNVKKEGKIVRVYVQNELYADYDLNVDGHYDIIDSQGNKLLVLVIHDKVVHVEDSTCPDHLCEMSDIQFSPEQIICLPN
ncbi:MAG TPA: NusG domain II-containing protein, partial [Clostridia bacterium]